MEQHLEKAQWGEINNKQKLHFLNAHPQANLELLESAMRDYPSVGQLIEFIEENVNDFGMQYDDTTCEWTVWLGKSIGDLNKKWSDIELINALWEMYKYIIK